MILEEEVLVSISKRNATRFELKGYEIPRYIDSYNRLRIKRGTEIMVRVEDLAEGSNAIVTKICDECGKHVPNQKYVTIINQRKEGDGRDLCNNCGQIKRGINQKNNVKYKKSLEHWAKINNKEYLLTEFSELNEKEPYQISFGSSDVYIWKCQKCNSQYDMGVNYRTTQNNNCPYCAGKKVNDTNCLWTTNPEIAELLLKKDRGYELTSGTHKSESFQCLKCGNVEEKMIYNVVRQGFNCSKCSDKISYPEKFIMKLLDQLNVEYEKQKVFKWSDYVFSNNESLVGRKRYDFFIPTFNLIIEVHGIQHYEKSFETIGDARTLQEEIENDLLKEKIAKANNMLYVVIDARKSSLEWIKENVMNSQIDKILNLSNIDWLVCHEFACDTLVRIACDLWNSGMKSTLDISEKLKCGRYIATNYLKQGAMLSWCDYDAKQEMVKNGLRRSPKIEIIQLSMENQFIKEWKSIKAASSALNIHPSSISSACKGNLKSAGKFKWVFKEYYDQQQKTN